MSWKAVDGIRPKRIKNIALGLVCLSTPLIFITLGCVGDPLGMGGSVAQEKKEQNVNSVQEGVQALGDEDVEPAQPASPRDLSRYDKAGPYDVNNVSRDEPLIRAKVREFLWHHWSNHKLGHVVATFHGREGQVSTFSYYVEPDEEGVWHVAVFVNAKSYDGFPSVDPGAPPRKARTHASEFKAYSLERVRTSADGSEKYGHLPANETLPANLYRVLLVDKNQAVQQGI